MFTGAYGLLQHRRNKYRVKKMLETEAWFIHGQAGNAQEVRIVFDGPPGRDMPTLVEIEDHAGRPIQLGQWRERPDGYRELVIPFHGNVVN